MVSGAGRDLEVLFRGQGDLFDRSDARPIDRNASPDHGRHTNLRPVARVGLDSGDAADLDASEAHVRSPIEAADVGEDGVIDLRRIVLRPTPPDDCKESDEDDEAGENEESGLDFGGGEFVLLRCHLPSFHWRPVRAFA